MAASCCTCMTWRFVPPRALVATLVPCIWAHVPVGAGLLVRGGDFSWPRLVVRGGNFSWPRLVERGGDSSCEAETCRGGSTSGKLVGDAANWPKTRRFASVGLDQDLLSSLS
jgi:hypothetical protein